jgi:hypothetical protein
MKPTLPDYLLAAMPSVLRIEGEFVIDKPTLEAAAGGEPRVRMFGGTGYSGGAIKQWWSRWPIVVDLAAMDISRQQIPLQYAHDSMDPETLLGQTSSVKNDGGTLQFSGSFYPDGKLRDHVVARADQGHQWQFSIGADPLGIQFVEAGTKIQINGREWVGPINVIRPSTLRELSVVRLGADPATSALVAQWAQGGNPMAENATNSQGGDPPVSTATAGVAAAATNNQATPPAAPSPAPAAPVQAAAAGPADPELVAAMRAEIEASRKAVAAATEALTKMQSLQATRDDRPTAPAGIVSGNLAAGVDADMVKAAAICMNAGMDTASLEASFKAPDRNGKVLNASQVDSLLQAAHSARRQVSLVQLVIEAARANGLDVPGYRLDANNAGPILRAAFSTHSIGNVLGTAYGKFALEAFMAPADPWREIFQPRPVSDFKEVTGVRSGGDFRFKPITNAGKIQDAELSDEARTIKAELYGRMGSLSFVDLANDDLGMVQSLGAELGEGAIIALQEDFWKTFEADNATYFTAVTPAAGNALSLTSLDTADQRFSTMESFGKKAVVDPNILLVPAALKNQAQELMSGTIVVTGENKTRPAVNVFAGRYRVITSRYLTSSSTWWLIGRSGAKAPMEVAFVSGQETPVIQSAEADFNTLGIQFRGYLPWGVKKGEKLTCVRMATA